MVSLKLLLAEALCQPWLGRLISALFRGRVPSLRFRGWRVATDVAGVDPGMVASIFWGIYESAEIRFLRRHLRPDLDVVELGASLGVVSAEVSRLQAPGHKRVCVEANPALVSILRQNVAANAPGRDVSVVHRAVDYGPERAPVRFFFGDSSISGHTVAPAGDPVEDEKYDLVPAVTLGELLSEFDIGPYALVCDIEGAEAGFIAHDAEALAACRQLIIELHDVSNSELGATVESMREALIQRHGFRQRDRHGPVFVFERD